MRRLLVPVLLVAATLAVFGGVVRHDFVVWDDPTFVYQNPDLNPPTRESLRRVWSTTNALTNTTYALLTLMGPPPRGTSLSTTLDPRAVHATSVALHALAVLAVFAIAGDLAGVRWAAAAGALLFAVHPVQVEAVAWGTGLKDVLSGSLGLTAIAAYLRHARGGPRAVAWWIVATAAFLLALLAKPTAAAVPIVAWVLDRTLLGRRWRTSAVALAPWIVAAAVVGLVVRASQPMGPTDFVAPLWARPFVAVDALAFYARSLVVPRDLCVDYGRAPERVLAAGWPWLAAVAATAALAAVGVVAAGRAWLTAATGAFVAGLLPVLGLVPFHFQRYSTVADRYLYLSMLGPALALAWVVARRAGRATVAAVALALVALAATAVAQVRTWRDSTALLEHTLRVNPGSWAAHDNMGGVLLDQGHPDRAIVEYREFVRLRPDAADAHYNLGNALLGVGREDDAIAEWAEALRLDPTFVPAHFNWATILARRGRLDDAIAHWAEAVRIRPDFAAAQAALDRARAEAARRAPR